MDQQTIEKVLNRMSEERAQDSQEIEYCKFSIEKHDQFIGNHVKQIDEITGELKSLQSNQEFLIARITEPIKKLEAKLGAHAVLLDRPVANEVINRHHFPKIFKATMTLFLVCILLSIGWYQTGQQLTLDRNNDTKWRKLRLSAKPLLAKIMLNIADSVDLEPDKTREVVENEEAHNLAVWELQQKMQADSTHMQELKKGTKNLK